MKKIVQSFFVVLSIICFSCSKDGVLITKNQLGEDWPLTVDECYIKCLTGYAIVAVVDDETYAVNDAARKMEQFEDIDQITRTNPNYPGEKEKMKLSDLEFEGLKMCK